MPGRNTYDDLIRQALGEQKFGNEVLGPVLDDVYGTATDVGNEPPTHVFSDKEQRVGKAWDALSHAQDIQQGQGRAESRYLDALDDPRLPYNLMTAQIHAADKQGPIDANVMLKAVEERQRRERK